MYNKHRWVVASQTQNRGQAWCTTWSSETEGWQLNIPREGGGDPQLQRGTASQWDKNGKKSRNGLLSAFLCFFCTLRKDGHKLCFIYSSLLLHCSVRKEWNWMFCRATPLHEQFPALPTRPCHFTHEQDNLFLWCTHSCLFILHVIFFCCVFI